MYNAGIFYPRNRQSCLTVTAITGAFRVSDHPPKAPVKGDINHDWLGSEDNKKNNTKIIQKYRWW